MVNKKTWEEFRNTGLLWWVNTILHMFGWAICVELDEYNNIKTAYPSRVKYRGFGDKQVTEGYIKVSNYLKENIDELVKEAEDE